MSPDYDMEASPDPPYYGDEPSSMLSGAPLQQHEQNDSSTIILSGISISVDDNAEEFDEVLTMERQNIKSASLVSERKVDSFKRSGAEDAEHVDLGVSRPQVPGGKYANWSPALVGEVDDADAQELEAEAETNDFPPAPVKPATPAKPSHLRAKPSIKPAKAPKPVGISGLVMSQHTAVAAGAADDDQASTATLAAEDASFAMLMAADDQSTFEPPPPGDATLKAENASFLALMAAEEEDGQPAADVIIDDGTARLSNEAMALEIQADAHAVAAHEEAQAELDAMLEEEALEEMVREMELEMENAVVKIQAGFRGMKARKEIAAARREAEAETEAETEAELQLIEEEAAAAYEAAIQEEMEEAATLIQASWRGAIDRKGRKQHATKTMLSWGGGGGESSSDGVLLGHGAEEDDETSV